VNVWNHLVEERQFLPAVHAGDFRDYQRMSRTFEEFAAAAGTGAVGLSGVLTDGETPLKIELIPVTYNFFSLLGVDPILGRHFTEEEEVFNGPRVAILSHELWTSRYGQDESIVGDAIQMDGNSFTVVGVLPRGFRLHLPAEAFQVRHADVWVPLQRDYSNLPPRNWTGYTVFGRMKPDVTLAQAQAEMDGIAAQLREAHQAHATSGMQIQLVPLQQDIVKRARPALLILFGAVGFVLMIACANVAHLLLLRGTARQRELAVRAALGASRQAIVRHVLAESLVIASLGAVLGLLLTWAGLEALRALQPPNLPRLMELGISLPVWTFAAAAAFVTALIFGLAPAYNASRADVVEMLKGGSRAGQSVAATRMQSALVVAEVAFSLMLLVGTGLMLRSYRALTDVQPGFEPGGALTFRVSLPRSEYPGRGEVLQFFAELQTSLSGLPDVEAVGGVSQLPLTGSIPLWPYAYDDETLTNFNLSADGKMVTPDYFRAMGSELIAGRTFYDRGSEETGPVVIVDEMLARRAWPDENPVGRELKIGFGENITAFTVVGVVEHIRAYDLRQDTREQIYLAHNQAPTRNMSLVVRTSGDPMMLAGAVRADVWAIDKNLPVDHLRPLQAYVSDNMADASFTLMLMSVFGALALLLASVGVYGVISYGVDQRSREFGIRMALGASAANVQRQVVGRSLTLAAIGVVIGLFCAYWLTRLVASLLYEVEATDPLTYTAVIMLLAGVAVLAGYLPARRVARIDAVAALQSD
jgi:putative ABC transport system permease protein